MRHIIAIKLQNESGALSRVAGLFSTRGYNIESLSVAPTQDPAVSRITLVTKGSESVIAQINAQLLKLVDVVTVEDMTGAEHLARELLLVKLRSDADRSDEIQGLTRSAGGRVLAQQGALSYIELTGAEAHLNQFITDLGRLGEIAEVVRSGVLGIAHAAPRLHAVG